MKKNIEKTKEKKRDFTQIYNECIRDKRLSLKAKGLLLIIQSADGNDKFSISKEYIKKCLCSDGEKSIKSACDELVKFGYLKIQKENTAKGFAYHYITFDGKSKGKDYLKKENDLKSNPDHLFPRVEKGGLGNAGLGNAGLGNAGLGNAGLGNADTNNTNINNTYINNIYSNDDDIYENSLTKNEISSDCIVANDISKFAYTTTQKKKLSSFEELKNREDLIIEINQKTNIYDDEFVKAFLHDYSEEKIYCDNFTEKYTARYTNIRTFKVAAVVKEYLIFAEVAQNVETADNAMKLLNDALESFTGEQKSRILQFDDATIESLFKEAEKLVSGEKKELVEDKQAYLSQIVRSKF